MGAVAAHARLLLRDDLWGTTGGRRDGPTDPGDDKQIKGIRPDGERYHALEPEAYAWVHATLAHSIVRGHELLGKPMRPDQIETFYTEWRLTGELIGVRERDLPEAGARSRSTSRR